MNKIKFIYNPYSGENSIVTDIDKVIMIHQRYDCIVEPFRISMENELADAFKNVDDSYKYVLVAGGDGTVDSVVNVMKKRDLDIPIAILPVGTANDFAKFIGMPLNVEKACEQILNSEPIFLDIGKINDKYFINVASTGLFTDVSQKTDVNLKNTIGKLAYYVTGIEQIHNLRKLKVKVHSEKMEYEGDMYLMLVFNGQTAGNFKLAYKAELTDGMLDVIIIKAGMIKETIAMFLKMLKTKHLEESKGLIYFKTDKLTIECQENIVTDIDGERGPDFPVDIECIKGGIRVLGLNNKKVKKV